MIIVNEKFRFILRVIFFSIIIFFKEIHADNGLSNLPIKVEVPRKTINFFAQSLYWYTSETFDWAFTLKSTPNSTQSSYKTLSFDWAPGFIIGLGYNMEHDMWDTRLSYTWFQSKANDSTSGAVTSAFLAARLSLLEPFAAGKANLDLNYNMFDLDFNRNFLVSKYISLQPSIGLKGGWINQEIYSNWKTVRILDLFTINASENVKQKFWAAGSKLGLFGKYYFKNFKNHFFSFIGKFESGYLWGHWAIRDKYVDNLSTEIFVKTQNRNFGSLVLHSFIGFGWDCNFNQDQSFFKLTLGYEIEDWLNQLQIFSDVSGSQNNDLILQGFNLGMHFDF
jgi:hypothetical protein